MPSHPSRAQSRVQVKTQESTPQSSSSGSSVRGRAHQPLEGHLGCFPASLHLKDASTAGFQILPHPPIFHSPHLRSTEPCVIFTLGHRQPNLPSFTDVRGAGARRLGSTAENTAAVPLPTDGCPPPAWRIQNGPHGKFQMNLKRDHTHR